MGGEGERREREGGEGIRRGREGEGGEGRGGREREGTLGVPPNFEILATPLSYNHVI